MSVISCAEEEGSVCTSGGANVDHLSAVYGGRRWNDPGVFVRLCAHKPARDTLFGLAPCLWRCVVGGRRDDTILGNVLN